MSLKFNYLGKLNSKSSEMFILLALIIAGSIIRFQYIDLSNPMPINDGGLFYQMSEELIANNFRIPRFTAYNDQIIPYTYPALTFYLAGYSKFIFGIDILTFEKFFPLLFSVLAIPIVYLLAKEILENQGKAYLATMIFAVSRPSFEWLLMGGGITRSPGYTLAILSIFLFLKAQKTKNLKLFLLSGITLGLTANFHLEKALFAVLAILILCLFFSKKFDFLKGLLLSGFTSILVFFPFFISSFKYHGLTPYLHAFSAGNSEFTLSLRSIVLFDFFSVSPFLDVASVFALLGFWKLVLKKDLYLPIWLLVICLFEPRGADKFALIPAAILFTYGFELIFKRISELKHQPNNRIEVYFSAILLIRILFTSWLSPILNSPLNYSLNQNDIAAMRWVQENTHPDDIFLVIPSDFWAADTTGEWFPVLAKRKSILTVQGLEWTGNFSKAIEKHQTFINTIDELGLETALSDMNMQFDYIYCSENDFNVLVKKCPQKITGFEIIYEMDSVKVYLRQ